MQMGMSVIIIKKINKRNQHEEEKIWSVIVKERVQQYRERQKF